MCHSLVDGWELDAGMMPSSGGRPEGGVAAITAGRTGDKPAADIG